ncbi:MAG: hypothetical protein ABSE64_02645 [Vulcanimicrobiaceae bacterium]|jgi:hypothetical protein
MSAEHIIARAVSRRQGFLFALCAIATLLVAIALWMTFSTYGSSGARWVPSGVPFVDRVASIQPGSPADAAGARVGDRLDIRDLSPAQRLRYRDGMVVGQKIVLPIRRGDARLSFALTPWPLTKDTFWRNDGWDQMLSIIGEFWCLFVAALIIWRRPESMEALILASLLILENGSVAIAAGLNFWVSPWPELDVILYAAAGPIFAAGQVLLATYALHFGRPISPPRRILTWIAYAFAALAGLTSLVAVIGEWFGVIDSNTWLFANTASTTVFVLANTMLPLGCAALALRAALPSERARLGWAAGALSVNYIAGAVFVLTHLFGTFARFGTILVDISTFFVPIGLTYALLRRRLLDVGFVLNRAAVFTIISLLIVGTFTLVEWALGSWLQTASRATNLAVSAALALGLGLSIHPIHIWVDRFVDGVFFRKRHEDERALRRLAREVAFTTDAVAIVERTKHELREHTDSTYADIVLRDGNGRYGDVDENDLALVALRASRAPVDLQTVQTALRGERAYPMLARDRLVGALIVGPKRTGETYAPDESAAIAEVAHGIGIALDLLGIAPENATPRLLDAIAALDSSVQALPDAIVDRLRRSRELL